MVINQKLINIINESRFRRRTQSRYYAEMGHLQKNNDRVLFEKIVIVRDNIIQWMRTRHDNIIIIIVVLTLGDIYFSRRRPKMTEDAFSRRSPPFDVSTPDQHCNRSISDHRLTTLWTQLWKFLLSYETAAT